MAKAEHLKTTQLRLPWRRQLTLIGAYARERLARQVHAVAFITAYLLLFQVFVLRAPVLDFAHIALGILAVVVGLAFFMEGLFLAIMPLGERCGLRLPARAGLGLLVLFAAVLGITATYAEPAIGFLKAQGSATLPWQAPLLYFMLNTGAPLTVGAVALGVGVAVVLGVFRFLRAWSIKPFLFSVIPALLVLSWWAARDPRTAAIIGLAWDSGGVTTGPVTVPLVIALGLGVSRIAGRGDEPASGLGVVAFASALPVVMVLLLALTLGPHFPMPSDKAEFFSEACHEHAVRVAGSENNLQHLAAQWIPPDPLATRLDTGERPDDNGAASTALAPAEWKAHVSSAFKAILPLACVLLFALLVVIRERLPQPDEVALGLVFSLIGLLIFNYGMDRGLSSLGNQAGQALPRAWEATEQPEKAVLYRDIDESLLIRAAQTNGLITEYLPTVHSSGPSFVPFLRERYDAAAREYRWIPEQPPVAGGDAFLGYALVLFFVFAMGVGATVAEPSLNALGVTLEELTTGTYKRRFLVLTVALGVGCGMVAGFGRILFDWPLSAMLVIAYVVALTLTFFSSEEITAIAWDCGGVTTGPITVPLVIAAGLGIGQRAGVAEAFGVVTMASAFPIIAVLTSGFVLAARRDSFEADEPPPDEESTALAELEAPP